MNTIEALQTRRSIRRYLDRPVDRALIEQIVSAASYAPSWKNTQTAGYIAVTDPAAREKIAAEMLPPYNAEIVRSAPVLMVMTTRTGRSGFERDGSFSTKKEDRWQYFDAGIACQSFCLAAHELGLSTVIMGIYDEDRLTEFLKPDAEHILTALIALGYADGEAACPKKRTVEELLQYV